MVKKAPKRVALIALAFATAFATGTALATYLGSGSWPTHALARCHIGSYATECSSAATAWSNATDLSLSYSCSPLNFQTLGGNYGNNGLAGYAYICAGPNESDCDHQTAWDGTYTYAEARNNVYYLGTWTSTERQFNCTHELGHCWSLYHDSRSTSVMQTGKLTVTAPDATNISEVNAKH